jgi:hypothetical protein
MKYVSDSERRIGELEVHVRKLEAALRRARPYVYNAEVADSADLEARWLALNQIDSVLGLSATQSCYEHPSTSETKAEPIQAPAKCSRDGCNNAAQPEHHCPYKAEINDDMESTCDCCETCQQDCADDI